MKSQAIVNPNFEKWNNTQLLLTIDFRVYLFQRSRHFARSIGKHKPDFRNLVQKRENLSFSLEVDMFTKMYIFVRMWFRGEK